MKLLVTGAVGRLGRDLVTLASKRYVVRAFDLPQVSFQPIEDVTNTEVFRGDITNLKDVREALRSVDGVIHLAAVLPPKSEQDRLQTMKVNLGGTRNLVEVLKENQVPLIFASSVSVYGVTAHEQPPIREDHVLHAYNAYSESKIEAEKLVKASGIPYIILRISAISVAELVELPDAIPFRADQRVEYVFVEDAAQALLSAFEMREALGGIYNIAGGASWQMTGEKYIKFFYDALGVEVEPNFSKEYTSLDWYDTSRSRFLNYQKTSLNDFLNRLRTVGEELGLR
ncbi:NAD(P)-dependent oxidoreductase [Candidatus Bathyarchaeota archaeon]|nr:NAD(P)-dependent oxidoreductase [Candidatus Bathyarchaeota archaeon]MBS7630641.1 NAD(P)-dependent oxidoreductase [Candidatus Bathyarchaeota archaeon]